VSFVRHDILIAGGDSFVGSAVAEYLSQCGHQVTASTRRRGQIGKDTPFLDLACPQTSALPAAEVVILAAAIARLADCEADPAHTRRVNVDGALALAGHYADRGAQVIFLSTDKVFDGVKPRRRREEATCPTTVYGRQKAAAEAGVLKHSNGAVVRLSKVLSRESELMQGWRTDLAAGRAITPFHDLRLAPVTLAGVAALIEKVIADRATGIFHCTGAEDRSYAELALAMVTHRGDDPGLVRPCATPKDMTPSAGLVDNTTLDMTLETERWNIRPPDFDEIAAELA
jgi:dTDP-4-dehydrorhamnose reductase